MNSWQSKFSEVSSFSSLKSSFSSSSDSFSPKFDMIFRNSLIEILLPAGLKIEFIASISSSSVYGSLYSLHFYEKPYARISSRNLWKLNLPVFSGSTLWFHSRIYEFDGVWYKDLTSSESSFVNILLLRCRLCHRSLCRKV